MSCDATCVLIAIFSFQCNKLLRFSVMLRTWSTSVLSKCQTYTKKRIYIYHPILNEIHIYLSLCMIIIITGYEYLLYHSICAYLICAVCISSAHKRYRKSQSKACILHPCSSIGHIRLRFKFTSTFVYSVQMYICAYVNRKHHRWPAYKII